MPVWYAFEYVQAYLHAFKVQVIFFGDEDSVVNVIVDIVSETVLMRVFA